MMDCDVGDGCGCRRAGETVLDLGGGAGFDCFLAARQVGPTGRAIGVDVTAQMVAKARDKARRAGVTNVDFRLGEIENSALTGCIGGAAHVDELERMLTEAGFADVAVRSRPECRVFIKDWMPGSGVEEYVASATVEAIKPSAVRSCCGPECCTPGASQ